MKQTLLKQLDRLEKLCLMERYGLITQKEKRLGEVLYGGPLKETLGIEISCLKLFKQALLEEVK